MWSTDTIARVTGCPAASVERNWPLIQHELEVRDIATPETCAAAIATVAIETASTFEPVREAFWLSEEWRQANLRYYPWYGRGFVQLTWQSNYRLYGEYVGVDLIADPDRALEPTVAAATVAEYFRARAVNFAADKRDWTLVRRLVQGGTGALDRLVSVANRLLAIPTEEPVVPTSKRFLAVDPRWSGGTPSDALMTRTIYSGPRFVVFPDSWPAVGRYLNLGQSVALVLARESGDPAQYADWATADWMLDRVHWFIGNEMDGSGSASWTMTPAEYADLWQRAGVLHGRRWVGGLCSGNVARARDYVQPDAYGLSAHIYTLNPSDAHAKVREYQSLGRVWVGETHPAEGYKLSDYAWPSGVNVTDFCFSNEMVDGLGLWA